MKKFTVITVLLLILTIVLSGCGGGTEKPKEEQIPQQETEQQDNGEVQEQETVEPDETPQQSVPTQSYQDTLMDKIPFSIDIGPGWEFRDLTVNGKHRRITITFEMDSSTIDDDPCISYYKAEVLGEDMYSELVGVGRTILPDIIVDYLRECRDEGDIYEAYFEMFEYDFIAYSFKGKDQEYIVFTIPASWELNTSSMIIANEQGRLLADLAVDKTYQVTLEGDDTERYMDSEGNTNFFSFNEDSITYLKISQKTDGVTYLTEYALNIDDDKITSTETGRTYKTTDTVPDLADISIY